MKIAMRLAVALSAATFLTACGGGGQDTENETNGEQAEAFDPSDDALELFADFVLQE